MNKLQDVDRCVNEKQNSDSGEMRQTAPCPSQTAIPESVSLDADQSTRIRELEAWLTRIVIFFRHASGLPLNLQAYCMRSEAHVALGHARLTSWAVELADILGQTTPEFAASCLASLGRIASLQPENDRQITTEESPSQASFPESPSESASTLVTVDEVSKEQDNAKS